MNARDRLVRKFTSEDGPSPYDVPILGQAIRQRNVRRYKQAHPYHDGVPSSKGTGPFRRRRRGRTPPTPGSVYNSGRQYN